MRWIGAFAIVTGLALALGPSLESAPLDGVTAKQVDVPAGGWTVTKRFRGGERACVQAVPLQSSNTTVEISVADAKGKKIADDKGRREAPDFAAVFWYPPRDGDYTITISSSRPDTFYVAIR